MSRVWIMSSKRPGDSSEVVWRVTYWGSPKSRAGEEGDPDDAPEYIHDCRTEAEARKYAIGVASLSINYWQSARVCQMRLEQVDGNVWDWEEVGSPIDVEARS